MYDTQLRRFIMKTLEITLLNYKINADYITE